MRFKTVDEVDEELRGSKKEQSFQDDMKTNIAKGIYEYVLNEVILPNGRNIVYEVIRGILSGIDNAAQQLIFKEVKYNNFKNPMREQKKDYVSYDKQYRDTSDHPNLRLTRGDLTFQSKYEADRALDRICDLMFDKELVTVEDICKIINVSAWYTDTYYGWRSVREMCVQQTSRGWYLYLPNPIKLK